MRIAYEDYSNIYGSYVPEVLTDAEREEYFGFGDIPKKIKMLAMQITKRFQIHGQSDGMYVANCIGLEGGIGDGKGGFYSDEIKDINKVVDAISGAYSSSVDSKEDLRKILVDGGISNTEMKNGIEKNIAFMKGLREKYYIKNNDEFQLQYNAACIKEAEMYLATL